MAIITPDKNTKISVLYAMFDEKGEVQLTGWKSKQKTIAAFRRSSHAKNKNYMLKAQKFVSRKETDSIKDS